MPVITAVNLLCVCVWICTYFRMAGSRPGLWRCSHALGLAYFSAAPLPFLGARLATAARAAAVVSHLFSRCTKISIVHVSRNISRVYVEIQSFSSCVKNGGESVWCRRARAEQPDVSLQLHGVPADWRPALPLLRLLLLLLLVRNTCAPTDKTNM